jgi:hypothetical protein
MKLRSLFCAVALAALVVPSLAHDFWMEPASFRPEPGKLLEVRLKVGDFAVGDEVQRAEQRILDFSLRSGASSKPIVGRDGAAPAGFVRVESAGTFVLGYRSNRTAVELDAAKFTGYLHERGLEHVLAERERLGESGRAVREVYSRCAKALVRAGDGPNTGFDLVLGYPLELLPEKNPCDLRAVAGDLEVLPVRLFYEGRPLANALVGALDLDAPPPANGAHQEPILARTDAEGRARLVLPRSGRWLLAAVHMVRAAPDSGADWESFWASLTFETPRTSAPVPGR